MVAFFRRYVFGPRLTEKERRRTWSVFNSLEDPPAFWHAEILAQVMIFFVVFFVYCTIAPITWYGKLELSLRLYVHLFVHQLTSRALD